VEIWGSWFLGLKTHILTHFLPETPKTDPKHLDKPINVHKTL
jgi:hypothetical protein